MNSASHRPATRPQALTRRYAIQQLAAGAAVTALTAFAQTSSSSEATTRKLKVNGIEMHVQVQGTGPAVLLCHGFPELHRSWRHQIKALSAQGFRVIAPDLRGYGQTDSPKPISSYTIIELVKDLTELLDALGESTCVIVGHDFGAVLAWNACLLEPTRFRAIAALSVPYSQRGTEAPMAVFKRFVGNRFFYIDYFQTPGVAEAELDSDMARALRAQYFTFSAAGERRRRALAPASRSAKFLDTLIDPGTAPAWMGEPELAQYVADYKRNGFAGPLNWYRNLDRNWELMAKYEGAKVMQPALFVVGEQDPVRGQTQRNFERLSETVPNLKQSVMLDNCGHWTQQEKPEEVNRLLIGFLKNL
jgi:pimeloyl-ACP methyl ester carboxylesterase